MEAMKRKSIWEMSVFTQEVIYKIVCELLDQDAHLDIKNLLILNPFLKKRLLKVLKLFDCYVKIEDPKDYISYTLGCEIYNFDILENPIPEEHRIGFLNGVKSIILNKKEPNLNEIIRIFPNLENLETNVNLKVIPKSLKSIYVVEFRDNNFDISKIHSKIERIKIHNADVIFSKKGGLNRFMYLKSLSLLHVRGLSEKVLNDFLKKSKTLESLTVENIKSKEILENCGNLKHFEVWNDDLNVEDVFKYIPNIESLYTFNCDIFNFEHLNKLEKLKELSLEKARIYKKEPIFDKLIKLEYINLNYCKFVKSIKGISLESLKYIHAEGTNIEDFEYLNKSKNEVDLYIDDYVQHRNLVIRPILNENIKIHICEDLL